MCSAWIMHRAILSALLCVSGLAAAWAEGSSLLQEVEKRVSHLGSDAFKERDEATAYLKATFEDLDRKGDADALRQALKILREADRQTKDPEVHERARELFRPYLVGAVMWKRELMKFQDNPEVIAFCAPGKKKVLVVAGGRCLGVYDRETGQPVWESKSLPGRVTTALVVEDAKLVVGGEGWIACYELGTAKVVWERKPGDLAPDKIRDLVFGQGKLMAATDDPVTSRCWLSALDIETGKTVWERKPAALPEGNGADGDTEIVLKTDGKFLLLIGSDEQYKGWLGIYNVKTGAPVLEMEPGKLPVCIQQAEFLEDGKGILLGGNMPPGQAWLGLYDLPSGKLSREWQPENRHFLRFELRGKECFAWGSSRLDEKQVWAGQYDLADGKAARELSFAVPSQAWFIQPLGGKRFVAGGGPWPRPQEGQWWGLYEMETVQTLWERKGLSSGRVKWHCWMGGAELLMLIEGVAGEWLECRDVESGEPRWQSDPAEAPQGVYRQGSGRITACDAGEKSVVALGIDYILLPTGLRKICWAMQVRRLGLVQP